ncbi:MAG: hypothetical protein GF311_13725 [Candidatus Lokiarchaeota archaeon]|nr:hypothetical protein [Candidatus Lokiarchaeota archaeon]
MTLKENPPLEKVIETIRKNQNLDSIAGLVCLNSLIINSTIEEILEFINKKRIEIPTKKVYTRLELLRHICLHYYIIYINNEPLQNNFESVLNYIGHEMCRDESLQLHLYGVDFIAKQDLIDAFSDWCADLGISVYDARKVSDENHIDLYLVRRTPLLRTETVFVRTGHEIDENEYQRVLQLITKTSKYATWNVFVTTPLAVYKIGLNRMIIDMDQSNVWLYIIDPVRKTIHGIIKGKKSKDYNSDLRDKYIEQLPREPIRAQTRLKEISTFKFNEKQSYNPDDYCTFDLLDVLEHDRLVSAPDEESDYSKIFRNLMIIDRESKIPIFSYLSEKVKDQILFSGFLSAMDDFVSQIGDTTSLKEINYKGFYVQAAYGKSVKMALFLSDQADKSLKERVDFLLEYFESNFSEEIEKFRDSGDTSILKDEKILPIVRQFLNI